jgi:hypothetical protein
MQENLADVVAENSNSTILPPQFKITGPKFRLFGTNIALKGLNYK